MPSVLFGQAPANPIGLLGFVIITFGIFIPLDEEVLLVARVTGRPAGIAKLHLILDPKLGK
jgi:hypothetical protein